MKSMQDQNIRTSVPLIHSQFNRRPCWAWAGWEPDRYYLRRGSNATPYFGNGAWISDWREKIESEENLRRLADQGVTVLLTQFYKGFGAEVERRVWPSLAKFVERAHQWNLNVWGYVQGHSIFGEFVFPYLPEARKWVAKDYNGNCQIWGSSYNRFAPCLSNKEHLEYIKEVIHHGLSEVNLNGIQLDNNYSKHCYCELCQTLFREWLDKRGDLEERTGIPTASGVSAPPLARDPRVIFDPLVQLWVEFGVGQRLAFMRELYAHIRQVNPEAELSTNPAYMKSYASRLTHGFDPQLEFSVCDYIAIENGNMPRYENGALFTQADKLLFSEAGGNKVFITSWRHGADGPSPPKGRRGIWSIQSEEYSFSHCLSGNNWILRPGSNKSELLWDQMGPESEAFFEAKEFFDNLENSIGLGQRRQYSEVCLYLNPKSMALCPTGDTLAAQAFLGFAIEQRIPLRIAFSGQRIAPEAKVILLCQQTWLGENDILQLREFHKLRGGEIWILGKVGLYNEFGTARNAPDIEAIVRSPGFVQLDVSPDRWVEVQRDSARYFRGNPVRYCEKAEPELMEIASRLSTRHTVAVEAEPGVLANVEINASGTLLVHVRDLRPECELTSGVRVRLDNSCWDGCKAFGYAPNWKLSSFEIEECVGRRFLIVPPFQHYAAVIIPPVSG